jgi:enterochelin esterase family protein
VFWFGVGTTEASFISRTKEVRAEFDKAGIHSSYYESAGTAHEFQTWRRCLHEFAPLLFRATGSTTKKG